MTQPLDISNTLIAKSDELNADDLMTGPVTVTITGVTRGTPEQPVNIETAEYPGKAWRPPKTVRRILAAAWGKYADQWVGRQATLYREPTVKWAGEEVGGIRISHLSHIDKSLRLSLQERRGAKAWHEVQPLATPKPAAPVSDEQIETASLEELRGLWGPASPTQKQRIQERAQRLETGDPQ